MRKKHITIFLLFFLIAIELVYINEYYEKINYDFFGNLKWTEGHVRMKVFNSDDMWVEPTIKKGTPYTFNLELLYETEDKSDQDWYLIVLLSKVQMKTSLYGKESFLNLIQQKSGEEKIYEITIVPEEVGEQELFVGVVENIEFPYDERTNMAYSSGNFVFYDTVKIEVVE